MELFFNKVMSAEEPVLSGWEQQLVQRHHSIWQGQEQPLVYCFVTDARMVRVQHLRHKVLALAGHRYCSRLVIMDKEVHESFYGLANSLHRVVGKYMSMY
jgi:hypothetical protein